MTSLCVHDADVWLCSTLAHLSRQVPHEMSCKKVRDTLWHRLCWHWYPALTAKVVADAEDAGARFAQLANCDGAAVSHQQL
eukprot:5987755-Amphidinium_carterae.1